MPNINSRDSVMDDFSSIDVQDTNTSHDLQSLDDIDVDKFFNSGSIQLQQENQGHVESDLMYQVYLNTQIAADQAVSCLQTGLLLSSQVVGDTITSSATDQQQYQQYISQQQMQQQLCQEQILSQVFPQPPRHSSMPMQNPQQIMATESKNTPSQASIQQSTPQPIPSPEQMTELEVTENFAKTVVQRREKLDSIMDDFSSIDIRDTDTSRDLESLDDIDMDKLFNVGCIHAQQEDQLNRVRQSTVQPIRDSHELQKIKEFARTFRPRRVKLGYSQSAVVSSIFELFGITCSQLDIWRFETFPDNEMNVDKMSRLNRLLYHWLLAIENKMCDHRISWPKKITGRKP